MPGLNRRQVSENAAARYRALLLNTRDPNRRRMLEDMIAREAAMAREFAAMSESEIVQPVATPIRKKA